MTAGYQIESDLRRKLLRVTLWGQFDEPEITRWGEERRTAALRLKRICGVHDALYDATRLVLPSQDAFLAIQRYMADPATRSRYAAIVTGSILQRMQLRRMSADRRMANRESIDYFETIAAAEIWLADARASAAA